MKTITLTIDSKKPYIEGQQSTLIFFFLSNFFQEKLIISFNLKVNLQEACKRESPLTNSMEYFLATGNLVSRKGLGILQVI